MGSTLSLITPTVSVLNNRTHMWGYLQFISDHLKRLISSGYTNNAYFIQSN